MKKTEKMEPGEKKIFTAEDYSADTYHCQCLVIGTGAGGSVAGALLAEAGYDVIFLEEGGYFPTESFTRNVGEMTARLYRNGGVFPILGIPLIALVEGCCVGGGTVVNGAGLFRTPNWILEEWKRKGLEGYSYTDLEKHFATIENDLHVVKTPIKEGTNKDTMKLIEGARKLGWRTELVPRAVKGCENYNNCSGGCPIGAKQSTLVTYLPRALKAGARLFTKCKAVKINHSKGIAHSVLAKVGKTITENNRTSKTIKIRFNELIVAGGAIQTPFLLRKSKISKRAGKNFEFHMNAKVIAEFGEPVDAEKGTMFPVQIHEFEKEDVYINTSVVKPSYLSVSLASHGWAVINEALKTFNRMVIFNATMRVQSQGHIISRFLNEPLVWYTFNPSDLKKIKLNIQRMSQVLFQVGAREVHLPVRGAHSLKSLEEVNLTLKKAKAGDIELNTVHIMASCPMGNNPAKSVVNPEGKLWNIKNVLLADASVLPSSLGQSPQETVMAFVHEMIRRHLSRKFNKKCSDW